MNVSIAFVELNKSLIWIRIRNFVFIDKWNFIPFYKIFFIIIPLKLRFFTHNYIAGKQTMKIFIILYWLNVARRCAVLFAYSRFKWNKAYFCFMSTHNITKDCFTIVIIIIIIVYSLLEENTSYEGLDYFPNGSVRYY